MEAIDHRLQTDARFKARVQNGINEFYQSTNQSNLSATQNLNTLSGPVTIPIVIHIVLPDPSIITDDDVNQFIIRLNADFAGLNADSINGTSFYNVRGHSKIRFALARRDPNGNYSTGIERKAGNTKFGNAEPQPIKKLTTGGLNPWPMTDYYNLWIGDGVGLLGIAPEIGPGTAETDGVIIDYIAFASNPCYSLSGYNLGRSAVHEIGHNFGLYHIFEGGCNTVNDFGQLTSASCSLPASLMAPSDDTPNQNTPTFNCETGNVISGCSASASPPGKMYQNFMDYTEDACFSMFTVGQVDRMHWVLENCRPGYLTTQGHIPPANAPLLDASVTAVINPGGVEIIGNNCRQNSTPVCEGSIIPKIKITNRGINTLTAITVGMKLNENVAINKSFPINLATGESTNVTLDAVMLVSGNNAIKLFTSSPNNGADQNPANDTLTKVVVISTPLNTPVTETFESAAFPPAGFTLFNPDNNFTWEIASPGNNSDKAITINNFNHDDPGQVDEIRTLPINTNGIDTLVISFDLAYKNYPGNADELRVLISSDCGTTFSTVYNKSGADLATAGSSTTGYTVPLPADWQRQTILVGKNQLSPDKIIVAFRNTNDFGNNIYIDNINIQPKFKRDLQVIDIGEPANVLCTSAITPTVTVKNTGSETITGFKVAYTINNGTPITPTVTGISILPGEIKLVTLNGGSVTTGSNIIKAFSFDPVSAAGMGDLNVLNDTLSKNVSLAGSSTVPLTEGFESIAFSPANWVLSNPDNKITWQRSSTGNKSSGSAMVNNYNYIDVKQKDDLYTPVLNYTGIDSIFLKFDVAAASNSGSPLTPKDTLEILLTKDCGNSFVSVYKKWGDDLQTIIDPGYNYTQEFFPSSTQWRTDSINLTAFALNSPVQIIFRNSNNHRNNIFIDNVNVFTKTLPLKLKQNGYLILPNPFKNEFAVWHYKQPTSLKLIAVYTTRGQLVYKKEFNGNANTFIPVNLNGKPPGNYIVRLAYIDASLNVSLVIIKN